LEQVYQVSPGFTIHKMYGKTSVFKGNRRVFFGAKICFSPATCSSHAGKEKLPCFLSHRRLHVSRKEQLIEII
ncbi:MAG: hypothetical protein IJ088_11335, partial [Clostridia bacterium]|nr:hypothetical protein [Clostridia bacterium]